MICNDSVTDVEFAGKTRGQFLMARGVRQGSFASGFFFKWRSILFLVGFTARLLPPDPEFLQPVPCAHADDFAVGALPFRFRSLVPALFPTFMAVDSIAGLNP